MLRTFVRALSLVAILAGTAAAAADSPKPAATKVDKKVAKKKSVKKKSVKKKAARKAKKKSTKAKSANATSANPTSDAAATRRPVP